MKTSFVFKGSGEPADEEEWAYEEVGLSREEIDAYFAARQVAAG